MNLTENLHWHTLKGLQKTLLGKPNLSSIEPIEDCGVYLDASKQNISPIVFEELLCLAQSLNLKEHIQALFSGKPLNTSERQPALHTALRDPRQQGLIINNMDALACIHQCLLRVFNYAEQIRQNKWFGHNGKPIKHIVNIGVGGSDIGPKWCLHALSKWRLDTLSYHFISDADPSAFDSACAPLSPDETLFIIASKSFTTPETLYNLNKAQQWLGDRRRCAQHCIAVTANEINAKNYGIEHVLPIWPWIGGRFSSTSAVNLITAIAIGPNAFQELLNGANAMDQHFLHRDWSQNLPVLLGLIGVWNINFLQAHQHLVLTYGRAFNRFVPFIQQLDMESNGKCIDKHGNQIHYATGPTVWGGPGNQAQHSYFQILCQGTHRFAADFISLKINNSEMINQMCRHVQKILFKGVQNRPNTSELIRGGIGVNHIALDTINPFNLGALIAMYEHKIFTQSVVWQTNPFDQPAVESAKKASKTPIVS